MYSYVYIIIYNYMITADLRKINGMKGSTYRPFKLKRPVIFAEKKLSCFGQDLNLPVFYRQVLLPRQLYRFSG